MIAIKREHKALLHLAAKAMTEIFKPESPFVSVRIMDILFDGIAIDCSNPNDDFAAKAACVQMKDNENFQIVNDTHLKFSLFNGVSENSKIFAHSLELYQIKFNGTS